MKYFFIIVCLLCVGRTKAQLPENRFSWGEEPLEWEDFEGVAEAGSPFDANTNSGISYSWSLKMQGDHVEFLYKVETFFYRDQSWVKEGKKSPGLLAHEQLHFDITELHGRMLRKQMAEFRVRPEMEIKKELRKIYEDVQNSRDKMQKEYDRQTAHSQNAEAQKKWQQQIAKQLQSLEEFSSKA